MTSPFGPTVLGEVWRTSQHLNARSCDGTTWSSAAVRQAGGARAPVERRVVAFGSSPQGRGQPEDSEAVAQRPRHPLSRRAGGPLSAGDQRAHGEDLFDPVPRRRRASSARRLTSRGPHDPKHRHADGTGAVDDQPRAEPRSRLVGPVPTARSTPARTGASAARPPQPARPRSAATGVGRVQVEAAVESGAGLPWPAPAVPAPAASLAVRGDDLPGRLSARSRRTFPGTARPYPAPPASLPVAST